MDLEIPKKILAAKGGSLDLSEVEQVMLTVILDLQDRVAELERKCHELSTSVKEIKPATSEKSQRNPD